MKPLRYLLMTALLLSWGGVQGQDTVRITLDSCLRYAYGHNTTILNAALGRENAEATLTGVKLNFLPSVSASASMGLAWDDNTTRSSNYGINASLPIFSGLANLNSLRQSKVGVEQSELQEQQARNSVGARIISAYLTILMNEEKLSYQQEVLETSRQQKLEGELKYSVGKILESDYKLLEASYLSAETEIENTRLTIKENRSTLYTLLCYEGTEILEVVPSTDSLTSSGRSLETFDTIYARSLRNLPDLKISQLDVDIARYNVNIARSSFLPTLALNAGTSYNEGSIISDDPVTNINGGLNTSLTLGLSVPLFSRGSAITSYRKSKIALREAELNYRQAEVDLHDEVEQLYTETQLALNRFRASEATAEAYHASYDVYTIKFSQGAVTAVEMLQQQERYLSALNEWLQYKYSYLLAEKQLDIYTGKEIKL